MAAAQEAGLVAGDQYVHASLRKIAGMSAACGAGRIVQMVTGRFDPENEQACPTCAELIAQT